MKDAEKAWFDYIAVEVASAFDQGGFKYAVRRKWSVRERPVEKSGLDDYEWKIIPDASQRGELQGESLEMTRPHMVPLSHYDFEGTYYILQCNLEKGCLRLLHDNSYCGGMGNFSTCTSTELCPENTVQDPTRWGDAGRTLIQCDIPPRGWLSTILLRHSERLKYSGRS